MCGAGEDGHLTPWLLQAVPPEDLASAGTSGLHRRWSLGGNSPQPGLAKTCNPNIDSWPTGLRLPFLPYPTRDRDACCLFIFQHLLNIYQDSDLILGLGETALSERILSYSVWSSLGGVTEKVAFRLKETASASPMWKRSRLSPLTRIKRHRTGDPEHMWGERHMWTGH